MPLQALWNKPHTTCIYICWLSNTYTNWNYLDYWILHKSNNFIKNESSCWGYSCYHWWTIIDIYNYLSTIVDTAKDYRNLNTWSIIFARENYDKYHVKLVIHLFVWFFCELLCLLILGAFICLSVVQAKCSYHVKIEMQLSVYRFSHRYVCVHICMHACTHTHIRTQTHTDTTHTQTDRQTDRQTHTHSFKKFLKLI